MKNAKWYLLTAALLLSFGAVVWLQGAGRSDASGDLSDPFLDPYAMTLAHRHAGPSMETAAEKAVDIGVAWPNGAPAAGKQSLLELTVSGQDGKLIEQFEIVNEKLLHLVAVSDDLQHFQHVHPEYKGKGKYELPLQFEYGGNYKLYADFQPSGMNELTRYAEAVVEGRQSLREPLTASSTLEADYGGAHVALSFDQTPTAMQAMTMTYTFTDADSGKPLQDLELYLGAVGHVVAVDGGMNDYLHIHPLNWASSGPQAVFGVSFPRSGLYKLWGQFQRNGEVMIVPFTINVQ
ncbi:hypothetical protein [Paenibacillus sp. NPDC058071]|uniref:hypothetical protein n=1 Tax=Paenibacillus sp. NPDC058071 TaxID=3346326 RepID=UPI0036DE3B44